MTQATDNWQPADDDAKLIVAQQRQQQQLSTISSSSPVDNAPVQLVDFRSRQRDVTNDVIVDKDGGRVNAVCDQE